MTKTTTEDRDGFRLETVDYTAEDEAYEDVVYEFVGADFGAPETCRVQWRQIGDGEWNDLTPGTTFGVSDLVEFQYTIYGEGHIDGLDIKIHGPSFESAVAETWPINWDWSDYYFNTLILACLRQAADVVVGRVLSGKNPVPDDRQELVNPLFQAIQSWYTGNPPLYAAHVDPLFLNSNELRMLGIAQEFADVIIREAAP